MPKPQEPVPGVLYEAPRRVLLLGHEDTDYKITPRHALSRQPNADVTKRLFDAFRNRGFGSARTSPSRLNVPYYWPRSSGRPRTAIPIFSNQHPKVWRQFKDFTWSQIRELMSDYGDVESSGSTVANPARNGQDIDMPGLARMARKLQPGCSSWIELPAADARLLTPEAPKRCRSDSCPRLGSVHDLGDWWGGARAAPITVRKRDPLSG